MLRSVENAKPTEVEQRARAFIQALQTLERASDADIAPLVELFADDAELHNAALDMRGDVLRGRDRIAEFWKQYKQQLGQAATRFHDLTVGDDAAALFWTTEGHDARGGPVCYHGCTYLRFGPQGKIAYFRGYYDTRQLQLRADISRDIAA